MPTEHPGLFATSFTVNVIWLKPALLVLLVMERQPPWAGQHQDTKEIEHWGREAGGHTPVCEDMEAAVRPVSGVVV